MKTVVKKCPLCNYVTSRTYNFERHCLSKHVGLLDKLGYLSCGKCLKVFASRSLLKNHEEKHHAIALGYKCNFCNNVVEENHMCEFKCNDCPRTFYSCVVYQRHVMIHRKLIDLLKFVSESSDHELLKHQLEMLTY